MRPLPLTVFLLVLAGLAVSVYRVPAVAVPVALCILGCFCVLALLRAAARDFDDGFTDPIDGTRYREELDRQCDPASEVIQDKARE